MKGAEKEQKSMQECDEVHKKGGKMEKKMLSPFRNESCVKNAVNSERERKKIPGLGGAGEV